MKLPKELEGKARITVHGTIMYLECLDCGEPKTTYNKQRGPRCLACGPKHLANQSAYNQKEGFRACRACGQEKELSSQYFGRRGDDFVSVCKVCSNKKTKEYRNRPENKARARELQAKYRDNGKKAEYYQKHKAKENEAQQRRRQKPEVRLRVNVSNAIRLGLQREEGSKLGQSILDHLPYSIAELKEHLERQFEAGMSWENWGKGGDKWNIDHIYPHSKLRYDTLDHPNFQKAWSLDNLRPLWETENIAKSDKIICEEPKKND